MKKIITAILVLGLSYFIIGCENLNTEMEVPEEVKIKSLNHNEGRIATPTNYLVDDFSDDLDPNKWLVSTRNWSAAVSQGQLAKNVSISDDNFLVLRANGMYHPDDELRMTGSAILSKDTFGPGKYEIAMKTHPRLGVVSAFWTFYYEDDNHNHEIDIEFPGNKSFRNILNTNWTGVNRNQYLTKVVETLTPANDGRWHKYTFEWMTDPSVVKYYVDDVLTSTIDVHVPTSKGQLWLGAWFANKWAGVADFETDYMLVDWVSYEPYDMPFVETIPSEGQTASLKDYPVKQKVDLKKNYVSNGNFEYFSNGWEISGDVSLVKQELEDGHMMAIFEDSKVSQHISAVYNDYLFQLKFQAKRLSGTNGYLRITYYDIDKNEISNSMYQYDIKNDDFGYHLATFLTPTGTESIKVSFETNENTTIFIDNIVMKLQNK